MRGNVAGHAALRIFDFEQTDHDPDIAWYSFQVTCPGCSAHLQGEAKLDFVKGRPVDAEVLEVRPCECGVELDENDLSGVVLDHFEAEWKLGTEAAETRYA